MPLPQIVVPIFIPIESGAFDFFGTGTLVLYSGRFFLVTAAHVFDGSAFSKELFVAQSPDPHALARLPETAIVSPMPKNLNRIDDVIDVAVISISEGMASGLCSTGATFLAIDGHFDRIEISVGDDLRFSGFPHYPQRMFPLPEGPMYIDPVSVILHLHQVSEKEAAVIYYDTKLHLVGRYLHPATRPVGFDSTSFEYESNHGMSGGAIWHCKNEHCEMVGIVTSWHPPSDKGYCMGTRLSELRSMFEAALCLC